MIHALPDYLANQGRRALRRLLPGIAAAVAAGLCALVSLGFATAAIFLVLRDAAGDTVAACGISALYAILALVAWMAVAPRRRASGPAMSSEAQRLEALLSECGTAQDQAALLAAVRLGQSLSPAQSLAVTLIAGFLAGRRLGR
jgi:hypothetical protein